MTYRSSFMKAKDVAEWLGVSESAIYKWVSEGDFPKPYKLGNADAQRRVGGIGKKSNSGWRNAVIPNATLILGPPGCGKTYTLIERVQAKLQEGVHPSRIGVVSFTTKAINEFIDRACSKFNLTRNDFPHFRTHTRRDITG